MNPGSAETSDGVVRSAPALGANGGQLVLRRRWRRRPLHDVVFYTPWVGSMLSSRQLLPPGGAETQVLMLARALARVGLRVAITAYGEAAELPATVAGVTIAPRPGYRKPRGTAQKVAEIGRIWKALWRTPSTTIICRTANHELGLVALYARLARRRLVFACPNVVAFEYRRVERRRPYRLMYNAGARLADAIVVQTEEQVALCESAVGRKPVLIRSIATPTPREDEVPVAFVWVGRLIWYKRPLEYLALARALPEATFWMVGVPSLAAREDSSGLAETVAQESTSLANLQLLDPRPNREIGALMARAVASVNTSDFEGMPNVLLEGWSRGVPALVLNHDPGGVVEKYRLGGFARGSMERLIELARQQWYGRNDRRDVSERCRRYIQDYHAPEVVAERWLHLLAAPPLPEAEGSTAEAESVCAA